MIFFSKIARNLKQYKLGVFGPACGIQNISSSMRRLPSLLSVQTRSPTFKLPIRRRPPCTRLT